MVDRQLCDGESFSESFREAADLQSCIASASGNCSREGKLWEEKELYLLKGVIIPPISLAWLKLALPSRGIPEERLVSLGSPGMVGLQTG